MIALVLAIFALAGGFLLVLDLLAGYFTTNAGRIAAGGAALACGLAAWLILN